ncbi:MAG: recombination mediator RecR [Myxococcota bacterium]
MNDDPIGELIALLGRLPSIGERTATRLAFHILGTDAEYARTLGGSLSKIHERIQKCRRCGNFCEGEYCRVCLHPSRDETLVCVVARVQDLVAIERSATFRGRYHVLHGLLSPLDGIGPDQLPMDSLLRRIDNEGIKEFVVATPLSVEGEATALYISELARPKNVKVSRIASGVPHGGELEFTDQVTLGRAFDGRREM